MSFRNKLQVKMMEQKLCLAVGPQLFSLIAVSFDKALCTQGSKPLGTHTVCTFKRTFPQTTTYKILSS